MSSQVLGYPAPYVHTWGLGRTSVEDGFRVATLWGILHYLQALDASRDRDLVIVANGYDSWFQLPPDVLIQRYHRINEEANKRIKKQMGKAADIEGIKQTIVFSADRHCRPNSQEDLACYMVPESPMSPKLYDRPTNPKTANSEARLANTPPKYLKHGVVVGPVKEMRALYRQAGKKANAYGPKSNLQRIFNEIFGEQEYQRQVMTARRPRANALSSWIKSQQHMETGLGSDSSLHGMNTFRGKPFEFGVGLDYAGLISQPSVNDQEDFAWLRFNSTTEIRKASQDIHIKHPRITSLPDDLQLARPPFFAFNAFQIDLPTDSTWSEVPLLTNVRTGVVPVMLYDNAGRAGKSERRDDWWSKMWFQPHLLPLIDANLPSSRRPVAVDVNHPQGDIVWFDEEPERRGARTESKDWVPWEDICKNSRKVFPNED